jgi:3-oxoacyl-[acyl-carrier protein] reductase
VTFRHTPVNFKEVSAVSLHGEVALVTGAGRGIGRAIGERLSRDGAAVVVHYAGSKEQAQEVVHADRHAGSFGTFAGGCEV